MNAITRIFLGWDQPLLVTTAEWLSQKYGRADELDLGQVLVVVPGRRAGRRLLELLVLRAEADARRLTPPRIETLGELPERLYPLQRPLASELVQQLVWAKALRETNRPLLEKIVPKPPQAEDALAWWSLGTLLWQQHQELAADGRDFGDVSARGRDVTGFTEGPRWEVLQQTQDIYLRTLDELGLWDVQTARLVAIRRREPQTDRDIVLVGTADMNQALRQVLDLVADRVTSLIAAPEAHQASFDSHGCLLPDAWSAASVEIPTSQIRVCDGPTEQAEQVAHELTSLADRYRADEVVVGLGDKHLGPFIERELASREVATRWIEGNSLNDSSPCRLLMAVAELLDRQRFENFAALVRHPDFEDWQAEQTAKLQSGQSQAIDLTALDELFRLHLPFSPEVLREILSQSLAKAPSIRSRHRRSRTNSLTKPTSVLTNHSPTDDEANSVPATESLSPLEEQAEPFAESARSLLSVVHEFLAPLERNSRALNQWAEPLRDWLTAVYGHREADEETIAGRVLTTALKRLNEILEEVREIPESVAPTVAAADAIRCVVRRTVGDLVPPEAIENSVELLGWLELAMDDTPVAIVTSFNEGFVPTSLNSDLFLPNELRRRLGLNDNTRRFARDAYAVSLLQASRREVVWIVGRRDAKGNPLIPSRLLFATDVASLPDRVLTLLNLPQTAATKSPTNESRVASDSPMSALPTNQLSWTLGATPHPQQLAEALNWSELVQPVREVTLNVTEFRSYLACPYRYFLKHVLKLRTLNDDAVELDALAFGNVLHEVLRRFGQSELRDSSDEDRLQRGLNKFKDEVAQEMFGTQRRAAVKVQLRQLETRLEAFARWQARWRYEGWVIEHAETPLGWSKNSDAERPAPTFEVDGIRVWLHGRIDRIDRHEMTGEHIVFDYKSGDKGALPEELHRKRKTEWVDLQLPLYRHLAKSLSLPAEPRLGYINLPKDVAATGAEFAEWTQDDLEDADSTAIHVARRIAQREFWPPASPPPKFFSEFDDICQVDVFGART